jgi:hypothetical protein
VKLWDLARGRCTKTLQLPGKVFALAVSADGRYAVASSAGSDNFPWHRRHDRGPLGLGERTSPSDAWKATPVP